MASKHEEIFKEAWIECFLNRNRDGKHKTLEQAEDEFKELISDKDGQEFIRMVYSCMDKYHNSFSKPTPRQYKK